MVWIGQFLIGLWTFFSFAIIQLYGMQIRSGLIGQEFGDEITSLDQVDYKNYASFCNRIS